MANFITKLFKSNSEERNSLENPHVPLSLGLASIGMGLPTDSNEHVTERSSLEVPTVLACVRILSEGVGSLPLRVYEDLVRGRKLAKDHPLYRTLALEPNPDSTAVNLWTTIMVHATLWQNAYVEIERNNAGQPVGLWPRLPWLTKPIRQNGVLNFETTDTAGGAKRYIKSDDMLHVIGFSVDALQGTSLIQLARQQVGLAMAAQKYSARYYANNARPGGIIKLSAPLSPEDMARLRADVEAMQSGVNIHRVAVMPPGMEWDSIAVNPVESQYIETCKFSVQEIASIFRVPGYMVGALEKVLKSTVEAQNSEFLTYSLRPWLERIEQEVQRKLFPPLGRNSGKYSVRFFVDELLRADYAARTAGYTAGRTGGWLSVNDIRELENLPVLEEGGDEYLVPLNMAPAAKDNQPLNAEDDGENQITPDSTAARTIFLPLVKDACGRMMARSKKDSTAFRTAFLPLITSMTAYLHTDKLPTDDYFEALAARCKEWGADSFEVEYDNLLAAIGKAE